MKNAIAALALILSAIPAAGQGIPDPTLSAEALTPAEERFLCLAAKDALGDVQRMRAAIKTEIDDSVEAGFDKLLELLVVVRLEIAKTETYERRCKVRPQ